MTGWAPGGGEVLDDEPGVDWTDGGRWRTWSTERKIAFRNALAAEAERRHTLWLCDLPLCDGEPHGPTRTGGPDYPVRHARWAQRPPADGERRVYSRKRCVYTTTIPWFEWLIMAGRGWGKTRTGAQFIKWRNDQIGLGHQIALIGRTAADVRDTMIEGESGLLRCYPRRDRPDYQPSKRRVVFANGGVAICYSSEEPDQLRGPQHHTAWLDELATFYALDDVITNYRLGMRLGRHPRAVITTTPKPHPEIRTILEDEATHYTRGTTYENLANLAEVFQANVIRKYEGTSKQAEELEGRYLDEAPGALWTRALLAQQVADPDLVHPILGEMEIVVAIDPAGRKRANASETGIMVCGKRGQEGFVLADLSGHYSPGEWATRAINAAKTWRAGYIVAEINNGWDMVEHTLRTGKIPYGVRLRPVTASKGKRVRAEPIGTLTERGLIWFVGEFEELTDQLATWTPDQDSPDRLDAMVWAFSHLFLRRRGMASVG